MNTATTTQWKVFLHFKCDNLSNVSSGDSCLIKDIKFSGCIKGKALCVLWKLNSGRLAGNEELFQERFSWYCLMESHIVGLKAGQINRIEFCFRKKKCLKRADSHLWQSKNEIEQKTKNKQNKQKLSYEKNIFSYFRFLQVFLF